MIEDEKYENTKKLLVSMADNLVELSELLKNISERPLIDPIGLSEICVRLENLTNNINYISQFSAKYALKKALTMLNGKDEQNTKCSSSEVVDNLFKELKENRE